MPENRLLPGETRTNHGAIGSTAAHGSRIMSRSWVAQLHQMLIKSFLIKKRNRKAAAMEILYPVG